MEELLLEEGSRVVVKQFETPLLNTLFLRKALGKKLKPAKESEPSQIDKAIIFSMIKTDDGKDYKEIAIKLLTKNGKPKGEAIELGYFGDGVWRYLFEDPLAHVRSYSERGPYYRVELDK